MNLLLVFRMLCLGMLWICSGDPLGKKKETCPKIYLSIGL